MTRTILILFIGLTFLKCKDYPTHKITAKGQVYNDTELPISAFMPATVKLFDQNEDKIKGQASIIGTCDIDINGHYEVITKHRTGVVGHIELDLTWPSQVRPFFKMSGGEKINLSKEINYNFTISCRSFLDRYFKNQNSTNYDSVIVFISNQDGNNKYKEINVNYSKLFASIQLVPYSKNYLTTKVYSGSSPTIRYDTIVPNCMIVINDTLIF